MAPSNEQSGKSGKGTTTHEDEQQQVHADPEHPGSEKDADETRPGGPRYKGGDWQKADDEKGRVGAGEDR